MLKPELLETSGLKLPKSNDFLWRYFDIHKFLHFLHERVVRFTRMDQFEDPLEGIPLTALLPFRSSMDLKLLNNLRLNELILDPELWKTVPLKLQKKLRAIHGIQRSSYVSCWFNEQRESVAMWNLYSNADGVAIKIPFGKLKRALIPVNDHLSSYYGGLVDYQNLIHTVSSSSGARKVAKVALRKDVSFRHENEFRFVLRTNGKQPKDVLGINSETLPLEKLGLKVICHPRMPEWKRKNVSMLLDSVGLQKALQPSELMLR